MHTLKVEGLSPRAWLNRCASAWPEDAALAFDGLTSEDGEVLLKDLCERFEAFDGYIGTCPVRLNPSFVANTRTLLGSLKKFREPLGSERELAKAAIERFVSNNERSRAGQIPRRFKPGMQRFLKEVLASYSECAANPSFGPGAVAERMSIIDRWEHIPSSGMYDFRDVFDMSSWGTGATAPCARLHAVPKDWNKKRLITVEPYEQSYLQHCTRRCLWKCLRRCRVAGLRALANPSCVDPQLRHKRLACQGSMDGTLATLDMSDASDFVGLKQVYEVFPGDVLADLERSRSEYYTYEGATSPAVISMYGGMGNATTFTVETLMFHAACWAIADYHRFSYSDSFVSCYGDDMIVSTKLAQLIIENDIFAEFGWSLNKNKSYWRPSSRFRESCGGQYYSGQDVTLLRYQGGYRGIRGLVAYRDLIMRCARNPRWRELTWTPWGEQNMLNSTRWVTEGALMTSVPWWPDTCGVPERRNNALWEHELLLPVVTVPKRIVPVMGLGPVYGAISGQLSWQTGTRRIRGRKAYGLLSPVPNRASIRNRWVTVAELDYMHPTFGAVPGAQQEPSDIDYLRGVLRRAGWSG